MLGGHTIRCCLMNKCVKRVADHECLLKSPSELSPLHTMFTVVGVQEESSHFFFEGSLGSRLGVALFTGD